MEKTYDRRADSVRARSLALACAEHPKTLEMFSLYRRLEHDYLNVMERAIRAEYLLDQMRTLLGKGENHYDRADECTAAASDLRVGEGCGA